MIVDNGKYYLYRHIRLDKNEIFYIGIGGKEAKKGGYYRANRVSNRNKIWNDIYNGCGKNIQVDIVLESNNWEFIKEKEKEFIAMYGRKNNNTGVLSNLTDGGDGAVGLVYTEERRKKQSDALKNSPFNLKGKKLPNWWKEKIRQTKFGTANPQYGKHTAVSKKVINVITKEIFPTILLAGENIGIKGRLLHQYLSGHRINKSPFVYLKTFDELGEEKCMQLINKVSGKNKSNSKVVVDTETGIEYKNAIDAAVVAGYKNLVYFRCMLAGTRINTTKFKYKNG